MMRGRLRLPTQVDSVEGPGQLDPAIFLRMISTRRAALLACYERALREDPTLSGSVRARAVITETGAVEEATIIESTVKAADVGSCVQRVLHGFRFNPGPMGGRVSYTVTFTYAPEG
jgi:TonB family protein